MTAIYKMLSNDYSLLRSCVGVNKNNTYAVILKNIPSCANIENNRGYSVSKNTEHFVMFVCNGRNGMSYMGQDVIKSFKRLEDIEKLSVDWNGYGAKPFSRKLIDKCERIVGALSVQPSIYPTGRNSIQFQYELNDRSYLEFEIYENRTMCLQVPKRVYSQANELELTDSEETRIKEIVDNFYGRNSTEK